jgi:hypothetical protein
MQIRLVKFCEIFGLKVQCFSIVKTPNFCNVMCCSRYLYSVECMCTVQVQVRPARSRVRSVQFAARLLPGHGR